jgi:hypothetical protein
MDNSDKIILDLCGGTGAWSEPYRKAGYDVHLLTLPDVDVTKTGHSKADLYIVTRGGYYTIPLRRIYGILSAPPCTEFSLAKGAAPRDFESAMTVVRACMDVIWQCRTYGGLKFWAMENPRGFLRQFMGKPAFTFEQWQFGTAGVKPTDLWGYFNMPKPTVKVCPEGLTYKRNGHVRSSIETPVCSDKYKHLKLNTAAIRAITPAGFAEAFFRANQ